MKEGWNYFASDHQFHLRLQILFELWIEIISDFFVLEDWLVHQDITNITVAEIKLHIQLLPLSYKLK